MIDTHGAPHDLARIENSILAYLEQSPDALDTARGVCDQWLAMLDPHPSQDMVERALQNLFRRGLVARELRNGSQALWSAPALRDEG